VAITATVIAAVAERGLALGDLIHRSPALNARDRLKCARLEPAAPRRSTDFDQFH